MPIVISLLLVLSVPRMNRPGWKYRFQQIADDYRLIFVNGYTPSLAAVLASPNLNAISGNIRPEDIADNLSMLLGFTLHNAPPDISELFGIDFPAWWIIKII
jgi:hypothetical protein